MTSRKKLKIHRRELRDSHNRGYTSRLVRKIAAAAVIMPALALTLANWDDFYNSKKTSVPRKGLEQNIVESKNSYKPEIMTSESIGYSHKLTESEGVIDDKLINAIIEVESGGNPYAVSKKGARGLMQLTPDAWEQVEKKLNYHKNVFNPRINKKVGTKYLKQIEDFCEDNHPTWNRVLPNQKRYTLVAAYNGGPNRLKRMSWDIGKMPRETRNYIKKIERIYF